MPPAPLKRGRTSAWGQKRKKCQSACKPGFVRQAGEPAHVTAIHLGRLLPDASRNLPGWPAWKPTRRPCGNLRHPYSVLLPVGFTLPLPLPVARWALTPPFHPYLRPDPHPGTRGTKAVCFLWHFPWGRPRRVLPGTVSPWSPDFPLPHPFGSRGSSRPAD